MYSRHQIHRNSERRDPSGHDRRGIRDGSSTKAEERHGGVTGRGRSSSINILEELQNIEHALSTVSTNSTDTSHHNYTGKRYIAPTRSSSLDWHEKTTPPRHTNESNSRGSTVSPSRNALLNSDQKHKGPHFSTHPRSPLVRFSEQLEVYSKHISQGCNTPTIPILRSKSSGSISKKSTPRDNTNNNTTYENPLSQTSRDPTPRVSILGVQERQDVARPEPAGKTPRAPVDSNQRAMSDPPVDRSLGLLLSPTVKLARRTNSLTMGNRQVHAGTLSLYHNDEFPQSSSDVHTNVFDNTDVELNPRRLSSDFTALGSQDRSLSLFSKTRSQALAPTPTNKEQAPTPNNKRTDWMIDTVEAHHKPPSAPSRTPPKEWSISMLFSNPCESPFTKKMTTLQPPLASVDMNKHNIASNIPAVLNVPTSFSRHGASDIEQRLSVVNAEQQNKLNQDNRSESSSESPREMLIGAHKNKGTEQWELGHILQSDQSSQSSMYGEDSLFSKDTALSTREILEGSETPVLDSKVHEKTTRRRGAPNRHALSYLQLGEDGSLQHDNVGTEIMALPKSIEVRIGNSTDGNRSDALGQDMTAGPLRGLFHNKTHSNRDDCEELNDDHFENSGRLGSPLEEDLSIVKKSTSETDSTDSGINIAGLSSSWDRLQKEFPGGYEEDEILIISRIAKKGGGRKKTVSWNIWVLICTVVICLVVGLPLYFVLTGREALESSEGSTVLPEPPTDAPSSSAPQTLKPMDFDSCISLYGDHASKYSHRYYSIRQHLRLVSVGQTAKIDESGTPQRKAICWLAESDGYSIDIGNENRAAIIQRYSLAVLYFSLARTNDHVSESLSLTDFLSAIPECQWDVIMCSEPGIVTALLLSDKNLVGNLPAEVGNLERLSFLELSLNQMTGGIPTTIQQLTALEYLGMSFNELTGTIPTALGRLSSLQYLDLRSSQVKGTIPSELGLLSNLESLLLEGNKLSGTIPSSLGNLHASQLMSFQRNYLSGRVDVELCELRDSGALRELTVDSWISCDCCTSI